MGNSVFDVACAFDCGRKCSALTEKKCGGCNFRKSADELAAGRKKAAKRLGTLPDEQQRRLRDSYHNKTTQKY